MKDNSYATEIDRKKVLSIFALYAMSILITLVGAVFSVISFVNDVSLPVLSSQVPGAVFGIIVLFLGLRYFFSVKKLKAEVYKSASKFSWNNFRKKK